MSDVFPAPNTCHKHLSQGKELGKNIVVRHRVKLLVALTYKFFLNSLDISIFLTKLTYPLIFQRNIMPSK